MGKKLAELVGRTARDEKVACFRLALSSSRGKCIDPENTKLSPSTVRGRDASRVSHESATRNGLKDLRPALRFSAMGEGWKGLASPLRPSGSKSGEVDQRGPHLSKREQSAYQVVQPFGQRALLPFEVRWSSPNLIKVKQ